jgi:hypothetical protein
MSTRPNCPNLSESATFGRAQVSEMSESPLGLGHSDKPRTPDRTRRPDDQPTLQRAALELARLGLTPRDIGVALGLGTGAVEALLGVTGPPG